MLARGMDTFTTSVSKACGLRPSKKIRQPGRKAGTGQITIITGTGPACRSLTLCSPKSAGWNSRAAPSIVSAKASSNAPYEAKPYYAVFANSCGLHSSSLAHALPTTIALNSRISSVAKAHTVLANCRGFCAAAALRATCSSSGSEGGALKDTNVTNSPRARLQ